MTTANKLAELGLLLQELQKSSETEQGNSYQQFLKQHAALLVAAEVKTEVFTALRTFFEQCVCKAQETFNAPLERNAIIALKHPALRNPWAHRHDNFPFYWKIMGERLRNLWYSNSKGYNVILPRHGDCPGELLFGSRPFLSMNKPYSSAVTLRVLQEQAHGQQLFIISLQTFEEMRDDKGMTLTFAGKPLLTSSYGLPPGVHRVNLGMFDHSACVSHDGSLLSITRCRQLLDLVHSALQSGMTVYVHCKAGMERSASLVIAYLMSYKNYFLSDAAKLVKKARPIAKSLQIMGPTLQHFLGKMFCAILLEDSQRMAGFMARDAAAINADLKPFLAYDVQAMQVSDCNNFIAVIKQLYKQDAEKFRKVIQCFDTKEKEKFARIIAGN
jgi:hypothetical protein